jgi:hypothetical protein
VAGSRQSLAQATGELTLSELVDWPWILFLTGSPMRAVLAPLFHQCTS